MVTSSDFSAVSMILLIRKVPVSFKKTNLQLWIATYIDFSVLLIRKVSLKNNLQVWMSTYCDFSAVSMVLPIRKVPVPYWGTNKKP